MAYIGKPPINVQTGGTGASTLNGILTGNGTSPFTASTVTQHGVLIGGISNTVSSTLVGSTGQVLQANSGLNPTYSTATYPSSTTINQILYSSGTNTVTGLATANRAVLTTTAAGVPVLTALATNGQLIIGSTAGAPAAATLSAGSGITITNGSNSITIAATGSEMVWTDEGVSFNAVAGNGYFTTATIAATLPATPTQGNMISFAVDAANVLTITANAGQIIRIGAAVSAVAGTAKSNAQGDSVTLVFRSSDNAWISTSVIGTFTVT